MKTNSKIITIIVAVICAALIVGLLVFKNKTPKNDFKVSVACNLPMTGYIGYYGEWIQNGLEMARTDLKETLDSANIVFDFDYQDNKGETKDAITIYQRQMAMQPTLYMSGITTQTMSIIDQIRKTDVPHLLWSWTPLEFDGTHQEFRCWVNYGLEGKHITEYCLSKNPQKVAYIHLNILGAKVQCDEVVVPALKASNPDIQIYVEEFPVETGSFRDIALKIKKFDADIIVVSGYKEHLLNITKDFQAYEIDKSKVLCSMDLLDALNEASNEVLEDYHVTAPAFNIESLQSEKTKTWIESYKKAKGILPTYTEAYGYDAMQMLAQAAIMSKEKGISLYEALRQVDIEGVTGRLHLDANGELEDNLHIGVFHNGVLMID